MAGLRVVALAAVLLIPHTAPVAQSADELMLRAVRFYRAESVTQVQAFVQIPLAMMTATPEGVLSYRVTVQVADSSGLTLQQDAWPQQHVPAELQEPGAFTVNSFVARVRPGKYRLEVTVEDSVTGRKQTATTEVTGFDGQPKASDLVLAPAMRPAGDSAPSGSEWLSGSTLVTAVAYLRLSPTRPDRSRAFYLLEAYTAGPDSGSMVVTVMDSTGSTLLRTRPTSVRLAAGGGVLLGQLNLEGLPSGQYTLSVVVQLTGDTATRSAQFTMGDLQESAERDSAITAVAQLTDSGYFSTMGEDELDQAFEPLSFIAGGRELRAYRGMSLQAKRHFLADFWRRRDPDTTTLRNEAREVFYGKIAYADTTYREHGQRSTPGWKTDRGRIYSKYGSPDEVLDRPRSGKAPPYLVWRFTRQRDLYFVFADRTGGLGAFKLIKTNDRNELNQPDWTEMLGADAVRDIGLFLGIDFFSGNAQTGNAPNF